MTEGPNPAPDADVAALDVMLPFVPVHGWTRHALAAGLGAAGRDPAEAAFLFPGGTTEMLESFFAVTLARAVQTAAPQVASEMRLSKRVRAVLAAFLAALDPHKEAARRAFALLLLPHHARLATRILSRLADGIWEAAGDQSEDASWYTKRASLGAILMPTLLYWLNDIEADQAGSLAFFDRRLAGLGRFGRMRARLRGTCGGLMGRRMRRTDRPAA
jgi:ubiquinone biosynthesis protein COQ9